MISPELGALLLTPFGPPGLKGGGGWGGGGGKGDPESLWGPFLHMERVTTKPSETPWCQFTDECPTTPPSPCLSYAKVRNYFGLCAYCSLAIKQWNVQR